MDLDGVRLTSLPFDQPVAEIVQRGEPTSRVYSGHWEPDRGRRNWTGVRTPRGLQGRLTSHAAATRNRALCAFRGLYGWAVRRGLLEKDPTAGMSKEHETARTRVLSDEEIRALITVSMWSTRTRLVLTFRAFAIARTRLATTGGNERLRRTGVGRFIFCAPASLPSMLSFR
jgi:hypothetical protein